MRSKQVLIPALISLGLLLLISLPSAAQVSEKEKAEQELQRRQELERKTFALLEEIIGSAWGLKLAENRSFVLVTVADLMWERDDKRARSLFWDALNSLNLTTTNPPAVGRATTSAKRLSNDEIANKYYATFGLRREFLRRVARRDPQLSLDMLRATRQPPLELKDIKYSLPGESDLEQEIAGEIAARDPQRALQIARESLARGLSIQLLNMLYRLRERNADLASEFAGDIIGKLRTENFETSTYAPVIAVWLLESSRAPKSAPVEEGRLSPGSQQLKLNDEQKRDLAEMIANAALNSSWKANLDSYVAEVMPEIEQFAPGRVAALQKRLAESNRKLTGEQKESKLYNSLFQSENAEEMIRAGATASEDYRATFHREAILIAVMRGKADSLREFINNQVTDKDRRNSLLDSLDSEQIGYAANRGETEVLKKLVAQIRLKEYRARAMAELAMMLEKKGQHQEASDLLDEAQTMIKTDLRSQTQSEALLSLLLGYALVNPAKAFSLIEPIIDRANDDISKALLVDKVFKSGFVKSNEIVLSAPGIPMDFALFKYGAGVSALASADFNRTKAAADRFQRSELRLMARLMLAQALLRRIPEAATPGP